MPVTAFRISLKLALVAVGASILSLAFMPEVQAQAQRQGRQDQERRTALGANPYEDPYRRDIFRSPYRNPYEDVGETPSVPEVDRFRQGVERFR